jgi:hypothetical protein
MQFDAKDAGRFTGAKIHFGHCGQRLAGRLNVCGYVIVFGKEVFFADVLCRSGGRQE